MATLADIRCIVDASAREAAARQLSETERLAWIGSQIETLLGAPAKARGRPRTSEQELERLTARAGALAAFEPLKKDRARSVINGVYVRIAEEEGKTPSAIQKAIDGYRRSQPEPADDELQPWLDSD